ncbi:ATP-dependent RNA helicase DBP10 [Ceratocystis lukuohia]|uniref:RNA helicase n=1 Tax=Ceratocystis lukuohia TaxID=2019550 RepID=A0ABR4MPZ7_9PEZI
MGRHAKTLAQQPDNEIDIFDSLNTQDNDEDDGKKKRYNIEAEDTEYGFDFDSMMNGEGKDDGGDGGEDDDEAFIALRQAAQFRKTTNIQGKSVKKGGGFQAMGINANLLRAITKKGFSVPTPIQRKTIPVILARKDVVGMARTGSGKTAAFVIPMIEHLKQHSARVGARALIMSPSRELAIQTLKVVKEFGKGTDLKSVLLVGGDSLEEQFSMMASNPDIIIATPGRFLHLKVEMHLDLSSIKYVVFDEADRLFEMGFAVQLTEILHALPLSRQTLLFSATLPASLVEFARAGLQDPELIRLDAETKVAPDLQSAFFTVKAEEKEGALLHILHDIIDMPTGTPEGAKRDFEKSKKRKGNPDAFGKGKPTEHSTILFAATKHRVEYLANLLQHAGFAVSYVYGSLDQEARRIQVENFRCGRTNILVVTDVAARGIDIPVLKNVINYDFPPQPKVFVHRVGRTARAGQTGWSYSLVRDIDAPYLIDLQLFLGRQLIVGQTKNEVSFAKDVVVGSLKRRPIEDNHEWVAKLVSELHDMTSIRQVAEKAERLYMKTRHSASAQSAKRAKELIASDNWTQLNMKFGIDTNPDSQALTKMLAKISGYRPPETIFEVARGGKSSSADALEVMREIRRKVVPKNRQPKETNEEDVEEDGDHDEDMGADDDDDIPAQRAPVDTSDSEMADPSDASMSEDDNDDDLEVTISDPKAQRKNQSDFADPEVFMSYTPRTLNAAEERGYGVHSGSQTGSFVEAARAVTMDLTNDDGAKSFGEPTRAAGMRWDKKNNKYVARANDEDGSRGSKLIVGESGVKIAASFKSGRFDRWKKAHHISMPRTGDTEKPSLARLAVSDVRSQSSNGNVMGGGRFKHKQEKAPKEADKWRDDYHVRKKRVAEARENRIGRFKDGQGSKKEIKGIDDIRKGRIEKEKKRLKNARPQRKKR